MTKHVPAIFDAKGNVLPSVRPRASAFAGGRSGGMPSLAPWVASLRSIDASTLPSKDMTVARIREMASQNGFLAGAQQQMVDEAIGSSFTLNWTPDLETLGLSRKWLRKNKRKVQRAWENYVNDDRCPLDASGKQNFSGLMGLAFRQFVGAEGECLAVVHYDERPGLDYRTSIQLVSPDRLSNPDCQADSTTLRGGIRQNLRGLPLGYYIQKGHPTDPWLDSPSYEWAYIPARTPWGRRRVIHFFESIAPDQSRGLGPLAAALETLKLGDKYQKTELEAALINAVFSAFIESPLDKTLLDEMTEDPEGISAYQEARADFAEVNPVMLNGSTVHRLFAGESIQTTGAGRANSAFDMFLKNVLRNAAAAMGRSYEQFANDWSSTNYSSARAAMLQAWKYLTARRKAFVDGFARVVFGLWLEEYILQGRLEVPEGTPGYWEAQAAWCKSRFLGPGRGWVDPVKEAQAANMRMESGLSTLEDELAEQGKDYIEVLDQRRQELDDLEERGLSMTPSTATVAVEADDPDARPGDKNTGQTQAFESRLRKLESIQERAALRAAG